MCNDSIAAVDLGLNDKGIELDKEQGSKWE